MKIYIYNRVIIAIALFSFAIVSCLDSVPEENPTYADISCISPIYFSKSDGIFSIYNLADTALFVPIHRMDVSEDQTYNVVSTVTDEDGNDASSIIKVDDSVSFPQGESLANIHVYVDGIQYSKNYTISISIEGIEESEFSNTTTVYTLTCEDPDAWELVCDTAVLVNNFWSSILSGSSITYEGITVKRYKDTNRFRIYNDHAKVIGFTPEPYPVPNKGMGALFQWEWQFIFQMAPDADNIKGDDYGIEIDCDKYSQKGARVLKAYMPFQSLGVKLNNIESTTYNVTDVWAGSVAYNLQSATTGEPLTEAMYPIGTFDTQTGVMKLGNIAVEYMGSAELGIQLCRSEIALYLDPNRMEMDYRDLNYKNVRRATFNSKAYLDDSGAYMSQGTKVAACVDTTYEDYDKTFRILAPYTTGNDLFFTHDKTTGRVKFPAGQQVGSTALGGYPIKCESKTCSYTKTEKEEYYTFNMTFYYTNDEGTRYDLGTFKEQLVLGSEITYYTSDDLVHDVPIEEYVGTWQGEFTYIQDLNTTVKYNLNIEMDDDWTLIVRGLAPYMESYNGYDSSLYLEWNDELGVFDLYPQFANTYNGYQISAMTANLDDPNSNLYQDNSLLVGFLENGNIAIVNNPNNREEVNCLVYFTSAQGGALVEPFIPYNLVLERQETEARAVMPEGIKTMMPWTSFREINRRSGHSNGTPSFAFGQTTSSGYKLLNLQEQKLRR